MLVEPRLEPTAKLRDCRVDGAVEECLLDEGWVRDDGNGRGALLQRRSQCGAG